MTALLGWGGVAGTLLFSITGYDCTTNWIIKVLWEFHWHRPVPKLRIASYTNSLLLGRCLLLGRKVMTNLDSILKSRDITLPTKVHLVKAVIFPVVMYGCESWIIKKAKHWRIDTFELWYWRRLLRVPWTARRSNQSILKSRIFIGRTDAEAETPILWLPDVKNWLIWKDPDAGKDWRWEEKGTTEDEMAGWHHWLDGRGFWWTPGVGDGQGDLECCDSWGRKESDTIEWLNWTVLTAECIVVFLWLTSNAFWHSKIQLKRALRSALRKMIKNWSPNCLFTVFSTLL